jgi:hypothetical protein
MPDGASPAALRAALSALLLTVDGVVKVDRPGGTPTWRTPSYERPRQIYFEVDWSSATELLYATQCNVWETVVLVVEGWMPHDYKSDTATAWDGLMRDVKDVIRRDRTLSDLVADSDVPQLVSNDYQEKPDSQSTPLCHHCRIEWSVRHDFDYELA